MREDGGMKAIEAAIERLSKCHPEHISQYGTGNEDRLTGGWVVVGGGRGAAGLRTVGLGQSRERQQSSVPACASASAAFPLCYW